MTLKQKQIEHAVEGMHSDGGGLYLRVQASGAKSWIFRFQLNGKRRAMGIGTLDMKPPVQARAEASRLLALVKTGTDPIERRNATVEQAKRDASASDTFREVAAEYIKTHRIGWANAKHADQWTNTLETYAHPVIGDKRVALIDMEDVLKIIKPIWEKKTETASRVRSRIELVLSYAKGRKMRQGENPATWRGNLDTQLSKPTKVKKVRHHPALPYGRLSAFMGALHALPGGGARALEFAILTAARSGEVRGATWSEIDLDERVWDVPASRMKAKKAHRVPLSDAAVSFLQGLDRSEKFELLFVGERGSKIAARGKAPISDMTLSAVIRRMNASDPAGLWVDKEGNQVVPHGFRSTFRDWAAEITTFPNEMVEMALAHAVGNKVEAAYRRGDMFERRRELMQVWGAYCTTPTQAKHEAV